MSHIECVTTNRFPYHSVVVAEGTAGDLMGRPKVWVFECGVCIHCPFKRKREFVYIQEGVKLTERPTSRGDKRADCSDPAPAIREINGEKFHELRELVVHIE